MKTNIKKVLLFAGLFVGLLVLVAVLSTASTRRGDLSPLPTQVAAFVSTTELPSATTDSADSVSPTAAIITPQPVSSATMLFQPSQSPSPQALAVPVAVPATATQPALPTPQPTIEPATITVPQQPVPDQVVIRFNPAASEQERQAYIASIGGTVTQNISALDTVVVNVPDASAVQIAPSDVVAQSEPNHFVSALIDVPPSDPYYGQQWALPAIGAPDAWLEMPADAPKVTVAVVDSGICADHPDLAGRILPGWDFVENDTQPQDAFGHGCGVAGIIAANIDDGIGMAGVASNAMILPLRVLDASGIGTYSNVAAAIVRATDDGAQVINLSLGGAYPSTVLQDAIDYAVARDVWVIAAAGNTGGSVLWPAAYAPVVAVGSVDQNLERSAFSSYGPEIDLLAPGRDIVVSAPDGSYRTMSGTSFAAPHVAGVAAVEVSLQHAILLGGITRINMDQEVQLPTNTPEILLTSPTPANVSDDPFSIIPGSVDITPDLEQALRNVISVNWGAALPASSYFTVSGLTVTDDWFFVSTVALTTLDPELGWRLTDADWFGLILIHEDISGTWVGAVEGTQTYSLMLSQIPQTLLSFEAKVSLDPLQRVNVLETYRFPWQQGKSAYYGTLGVHDNGFASVVTGWKAVDFISDGDSGAGHFSNQLIPAAAGTIGYYCQPRNGGNTTAVKIGDLMYAHMLYDSTKHFTGRQVTLQDDLGVLKAGNFDENCGYASQGTNWFHVHMGFPNSNLAMGGWTLNVTDGIWRRNNESRSAGSWIQGDSPTSACANYSYDGVVLLAEAQCLGDKREFNSAGFRNMPDHSFNDAASSIHVGSGWSVRVWENDNRGGATSCIRERKWDLSQDKYESNSSRSMNDDISSIEVFHNSDCSVAQGWTANYYDTVDRWADINNSGNFRCSENFTGTSLDRDYGSGARCGMDGDSWVGDYSTTINFAAGNYVFHIEHDDGARLWIDGQNKADYGGSGNDRAGCSNGISLTGGNHSLRVMLREDGGDARIRVSWSTDLTVCYTPSVTANPAAVTSGQTVTATWADLSTTGSDWISLHPAGAPDSTYETWQYVTSSSGSINFTAPSQSGSYNFRLFRSGTKIATSNSFQVTASPPGAPTLSSPSNNATVARFSDITLSWSATSGATEYYAEFWGGPSVALNSGWTTNTSWFIGSTWGGSYQWRVRARNSAGTGSWSATRTLSVNYGAPTNLQAQAASRTQVNLTWSASADAPGNIDGYRIYRGSSTIGTVSSGTTTFSNTDLACGQTYSYEVRAYKGSVESPASNSASVTTQACPVDTTPPTVTITSPQPDGMINTNQLTVRATASDAESGINNLVFFIGYDNGTAAAGLSLPPETPPAPSTDEVSSQEWGWHKQIRDTDGSDGWSVTFDLSDIADQVIAVWVYAYDNAGNEAHHDFGGVTIDRTAPTGSMTSPQRSSFLTGPILNLTANITDQMSGVASVKFAYWNGTTWVLLSTDTSAPYSYNWNTSQIAEGFLWVTASALDKAGNSSDWLTGDDKWTFFTIDRTPPVSSVNALPSTYTAPDFTVSWSGSDNLSAAQGLRYDVQYQGGCTGAWVDWVSLGDMTSATFYSWTTQDYCFRSRARDQAGNVENWPSVPDARTTVYIPEAIINGSVTFQGRGNPPDESWRVPLRVQLWFYGGTEPFYDQTLTTDDYGRFTIRGLLPTTYQIRVRNPHSLSTMQSIALNGGTNAVNIGILREGDINSDGLIDLSDYSRLALSFLKLPGQAGYNPLADFNGDNIVDLSDYALLAMNFFKSGAGAMSFVSAAAAAVDLNIVPSTAVVSAGEEFEIQIEAVAGAQPVIGIQAFLNFDPSVAQVVRITSGGVLPNVLTSNWDNALGNINYAALKLSSSEEYPSGTFTLMTVRMRAVAATPVSAVMFNTARPRTTKVVANDDTGNSVLGNVGNGLIIASNLPPAGAPLRNYYTTNVPVLRWGRVSSATAYEVQVATNVTFFSTTIVYTYIGSVLETTISPALADGYYYWRVRAQLSSGAWGPWSTADSFVIDAP